MLVVAGRVFAALMALVTIRVGTTFLTPEQYGELSLLIAIQMFCGLFLVNPVGQHINLHTHAWWDDGTLIARLRSYRPYVLAVSLIGGGAVIFTGTAQTPVQIFWTSVTVFFMVCAGTWNATLIPMLNMLGFRSASLLWSIITTATGLAAAVILLWWIPSATAWFAGQAIGLGVGALGARFIFQQQEGLSKLPSHNLPLVNRQTIVKYCLPLAAATGFMWLQLSGYRFVIEAYWGLAQLGFFAVGLQLAGQIWALAESLAVQFLYPLFYRRISDSKNSMLVESALSDLLNTLAPIYLVLTGALILGAPYLLKILVASQFHDAVRFVMIGAVIEMCRVLANLLSNAAHIKRKTGALTWPYGAGALIVITTIWFTGKFNEEIIWAGASLIFGSLSMLFIMWVNMFRQVRFKLDISRCVVGGGIMSLMIGLTQWAPGATDFKSSLKLLIVIGITTSLAILALLWKNSATSRLLNVALR